MPTTLEAKPRPKQAKYKDIADLLRRQIRNNKLGAGERMPSFDEVCEIYDVTPNTVVRVYGLLEQEGLVERQRGRGIFVAERKRKVTGNIGIIGSESFRRPQLDYYNLFMHGMEEAAARSQQHLLFLGTEKTWDVRSCEKVDGIIVAGVNQVTHMIRRIPAGLPLITIFTAGKNVSSVTVDDYQGARLAVEYLRQAKHHRIACLMEELPVLSRRRFNGYIDALSEEGIDVITDWIRLTPTVDVSKEDHPYLTWGREQMQAWLREGWHETGCTALFVQNEMAAIGVMQVLQEGGIRVPEQVSVIGFDGTPLCDYVSPRLCAVEIPLEEIGARAIELLNRQLAKELREPENRVLPLRIRKGASVASLS